MYCAIANTSSEGIVKKHGSGRHKNRSNRIPVATKQSVVDHISCFPVVESHYVRNTSTKEYLGDELSLSKMYHLLYITWCEDKDILAPAKRWY